MPRYDDWNNQTSAEAKSKLNGAFSNETGVGHDHSGMGQGAPILNAANVSTTINGHTISNIFESDGVTVKNATNAANASNTSSITTGAFASHFGFKMGSVGDGEIIPLPDGGFTHSQCKWIVTPNTFSGREADNQSVSWRCYADPSTRQVTCKYSSYFGTWSGTASYLIIGVK
jgi:hypothetical protein